MAATVLAVVGIASWSLASGAVDVSPGDVVGVLSRRLGVALGAEPSVQADAVLWGIRLPRVMGGLLVGAALGAAGTGLQGVFRNPMADPALIGIVPGAALGALATYALVGGSGGVAAAPLGGAIAGAATALTIRRLGDRAPGDRSRFILIGVALGAALFAWVGLVVYAWDNPRVPPLEFWFLGGLSGSTWAMVRVMTLVAATSLGTLAMAARSLDVMALGESEARHLGVPVDRVAVVTLTAAGVAAGAAVGAAGAIGFVGLTVPYAMRRLVGPRHGPLLAATALGGAGFVALTDLGARTLVSPIEIPVGVLTALLGGPLFLWLLVRRDGSRT